MSLALNSKVVIVSTFQVFMTAFLLSYFKVDITLPKINLLSRLRHQSSASASHDDSTTASSEKPDVRGLDNIQNDSKTKHRHKKLKLLTNSQLAAYDGSESSAGLYLALLGTVYDVEAGMKHYGPEGGYHFFAGKDATRAFVTGDFTDNGLVDDVAGLSPQDLIGIEDWIQFYEKEYVKIGYVQGTYYDVHGKPTLKLKEAKKLFESAHKWQNSQKADQERFPACNSEWVQGKGGRVWCSNKSGGVTRDWVGVPRKLFTPGSGHSRCACVKDTGPPQEGTDVDEEHHDDSSNPSLRLYDNCDPKAVSCNIV